MPRLDPYQQRTQASGPLPDVGIAPNIAQVAGAALDHVAQNIERVREHDDNVDVAKALSDLRMQSAKRMVEGEASAAADAAGFTPDRLKEFDDDVDAIAKTTRSPRAAAVFKQHTQDIRPQVGERAMVFEASRRSAYRADAAETAAQQSRSVLELDPTQYESIRAEQLGAIPTLGLEPADRLRIARNIENNLAEGAAIGLSKQDPRAALAELSNPKSADARFAKLSADSRRRIETFAKGQLADKTAQGVVDAYKRDARMGTQALVALNKSDLPQDILNDARGKVRQDLGLLHAERREQFGQQVTALERSISQGTPGADAELQAQQLYHRSAYSPEQYTNVLQQIDESRQRGASKAAEIASVEQAILSGQRLDPKDTKVVNAVDTWFTASADVNHIAPGSNEWINNAAALAQRTNILPPEAMSWARKTILSGEPDLAVPAANAIRRWADAAPAAYAYFDDPQLKANAEAIDGMVRAGVPGAKAVEIARANTYDIPEARKKALDADYTKQKYAGSNANFLQSSMNSDDNFDREVIPNAPQAPLAMQDEYNALVRTYFDHTNGDIRRARDLAWHDLRGTYGVSTVNGAPQILKHAPELVFPGIDPAVIRSDIDASAKAAGVPGKAILTPSSDTADTGGIVWKLTTIDGDGYVEVLLDEKNRPIKYAIPTDTATYLKAQEDTKRAAVDAARAESARRREAAGVFPNEAFGGY
jgi:hypothetical protein